MIISSFHVLWALWLVLPTWRSARSSLQRHLISTICCLPFFYIDVQSSLAPFHFSRISRCCLRVFSLGHDSWDNFQLIYTWFWTCSHCSQIQSDFLEPWSFLLLADFSTVPKSNFSNVGTILNYIGNIRRSLLRVNPSISIFTSSSIILTTIIKYHCD